jgi:hypothetical protein
MKRETEQEKAAREGFTGLCIFLLMIWWEAWQR